MPRFTVPAIVKEIGQSLRLAGGKDILVGGWVRDQLLGKNGPDLDIEVFGISSYERLCHVLSAFGMPVLVGQAFGVAKLTIDGLQLDYALPRRDNKIGIGHKGFDVEIYPHMSFAEAASRRDFTINAIGYDWQADELLDPYGGTPDLEAHILRHVGPAFSEDPLRVYRALQFAARFSLEIHPETLALCQKIALDELPKERVFAELEKLMLAAPRPSEGWEWARKMGVLSHFPELAALIDTPQDPQWHPEGDVWIHTMMVVDEMAKLRTGNPAQDRVLMFAALCHDFGKPPTTQFFDGRWRSHNHEHEGVKPTKSFLKRLTDETTFIKEVCDLVAEHLKPALLFKSAQTGTVGDTAIRRLSLRVNIARLLLLAQADHAGRTTEDAHRFEAVEWLRDRAEALRVTHGRPTPFLQGRDVISRGVSPGPEVGSILRKSYELQLDGVLASRQEALGWLEAIS